uniref:Uncharacterized protein n=1 Tax=Rhizophora mucronata TaxID=61149 RepID=A0A2P2QMK3_RHIMU
MLGTSGKAHKVVWHTSNWVSFDSTNKLSVIEMKC